MFLKCNLNPKGENIDDCYIRATSLATGVPYDEVEAEMIWRGKELVCSPNHLATVADFLMDRGWRLYQYTEGKPTVKQFCEDHNDGIYLPVCNNHITAVVDGNVLDTWNCHRLRVKYYFTFDK